MHAAIIMQEHGLTLQSWWSWDPPALSLLTQKVSLESFLATTRRHTQTVTQHRAEMLCRENKAKSMRFCRREQFGILSQSVSNSEIVWEFLAYIEGMQDALQWQLAGMCRLCIWDSPSQPSRTRDVVQCTCLISTSRVIEWFAPLLHANPSPLDSVTQLTLVYPQLRYLVRHVHPINMVKGLTKNMEIINYLVEQWRIDVAIWPCKNNYLIIIRTFCTACIIMQEHGLTLQSWWSWDPPPLSLLTQQVSLESSLATTSRHTQTVTQRRVEMLCKREQTQVGYKAVLSWNWRKVYYKELPFFVKHFANYTLFFTKCFVNRNTFYLITLLP